MNPNISMANINAMGGAPVPMMNNGSVNPLAANSSGVRPPPSNEQHRLSLNTYIYEYFLRQGHYDCARSMLNSEVAMQVTKDERRDENGGGMNGTGDSMDTDSKDDLDRKIPSDLPMPNLMTPPTESSFLFDWFSLFWDVFNAQRGKGGAGNVHQYVRQEMLRTMGPDPQLYQAQLMRNMQNGPMSMMNKPGNQLVRTAIANNQNNPQIQMLQQQAKQSQMQRDPSGMDANRDRPSSPSQGDGAPSPSKRPRVDAANFNANQPGAMMLNGRQGQGIPPQMAPNPNSAAAAANQMLIANNINPNTLNPAQFQNFVNSTPNSQQKSIAAYAQNLQQHHGSQMGGKPVMPNAGGPPGQGSPMMQPPEGTSITPFYNPNEMGNHAGMRPGMNSQQGGGSNHALQDYQMQLMLLEQQNKRRLMMARQEQDNMGGMPRDGQPTIQGAPGQVPAGVNQQFPDSSPQGVRSGSSPNPTEQMKRAGQMNNSGISSPIPEGSQARSSPNSMNFMGGGQVDPNMGPPFNMQPNGMRPPSSHPATHFNGQMTPQMMAARQQQGVQNAMQQWQGPNGQMVGPNMQGANPPVSNNPQQQNRAMPPPSAPTAGTAHANNRTTASPQQSAAAPPTPTQANKPAPKSKKETKAAKEKRAAANKKGAQNNANANVTSTPAGDTNNGAEGGEAAAPATPVPPPNPQGFNKNGQNGTQLPAGQTASQTGSTVAPPTSTQTQSQGDPNGGMNIENFGIFEVGSIDLANPISSTDVLNDFDFDSFLHDGDGANEGFDFNSFGGLEGNEIGAD